MKIAFKIVKIINIIALLFLLLGGYGLAVTGALQVFAATIYLLIFPKNKLIYIYFGLVGLFFLLWDGNDFDYLLAIPIFLIFFLSFIIHFQKK
ncbi:hypothetical protein [Flavobacterium orientale]|jgi:hypothetical protein|uniref:Uncharacterized protein n=1 Tax=Flavobacterium orientale TaxID=1756020 RepID=A0A917DF90_9FLAO|nr:hypothetical protein [Flavobacterium orientale]GGD32212.1 hypothetical protein GCM10011343_22840 [Flavobacterium orientale]